MKKITYFKMLLAAIVLIVWSLSASAQLLVEDFNYTAGASLTANGWSAHSGSGTNAVKTTTPVMTYTGYASSGVGNEITMTTSGEDDNKAFTNTTTGSIYVAFLVYVTASQSGDYFLHFCQSSGTTAANFFGRVFVKKDATLTTFGFGISKASSSSSTYTPTTYILNTTYLVVLKYTFNTGTTSDDAVSLFVNPVIGSSEPTPTLTLTETSTTDATGITAIALRQGTAGSMPTVKVDGIRVATVWSDAVTAPGNPKTAMPTFSASPGNVTTPQSVSLSCTTASSSIYYTIDGTTPDNISNGTLYAGTPFSVSSTTTVKAIAYATGYDPSSVNTGIYTFPTQIATIAALRAASTSGFYQLTNQVLLSYQSPGTYAKPKFIQDATGGIYIYDAAAKMTTSYNVGDGITGLAGTISLYSGYLLQFAPVADAGVASSTGNTITPQTTTLANIGNYPGQLVTVKNATITGTGNFASATAYTITDASAGKLRTFFTDLPYIGSAIPLTAQDITGVVYNYSLTEADIIPRTAADMLNTTVTAINQASTASTIYTSNGNVVLTEIAGRSVEIYNSIGQRLISTKTLEGVNTIPVSTRGVVLVKVDNRITRVIL